MKAGSKAPWLSTFTVRGLDRSPIHAKLVPMEPQSPHSSPHPSPARAMSKHRIEALTDGVYAIAITLLVLDLRVPHNIEVSTEHELLMALAQLIPNFIAWLISFFVLAIFWFAHNRLFQWLKATDGLLIWLMIVSLLFVCFLPFASSLTGQFAGMFAAQAVYAATMVGMALASMAIVHHLWRHPELCHEPMPRGHYIAAMFRSVGIILSAATALTIAFYQPIFATFAFMLMIIFTAISRRFERQTVTAKTD